ncbi:MAG: hypothetical protein IJ215_00020 [Clostridia bacterium]|nr:hypothetical protein [Clostridia bacterium]
MKNKTNETIDISDLQEKIENSNISEKNIFKLFLIVYVIATSLLLIFFALYAVKDPTLLIKGVIGYCIVFFVICVPLSVYYLLIANRKDRLSKQMYENALLKYLKEYNYSSKLPSWKVLDDSILKTHLRFFYTRRKGTIDYFLDGCKCYMCCLSTGSYRTTVRHLTNIVLWTFIRKDLKTHSMLNINYKTNNSLKKDEVEANDRISEENKQLLDKILNKYGKNIEFATNGKVIEFLVRDNSFIIPDIVHEELISKEYIERNIKILEHMIEEIEEFLEKI